MTRWTLGVVLVLGAVVLPACGDSFDRGASDGGAGGSGAAGGGGTGSGSGSAGATGSGAAGGGDAGGGPAEGAIDPIALGHTWTYDVEEIGSFPLCPPGSHTAETIDELDLDGKHAFEVTSLCANTASSHYAVDGDVVQVHYDGTWVLALDAPVEEGHTWSNGFSTFTWHDEGLVTVEAGAFDDCWRATQNVAYEAFTIFCRGVGPVHWRSVDLNGAGFDALLTAKSF